VNGTNETKRRLILFLILTYAIAWALFFLVPLRGIAYGTGRSTLIIMGAMFAPAAGSILTRLITKEGFGNLYIRPHFRGHIKAYLLVFFGPTLLILISAALYFLVFPGQFDADLSVFAALEASNPGVSPQQMLLVSLLQMILIGPVINILPTMGEELGWRGYLLPKLRELSSDRAALVVTGLIWGVWHAPVIAMGHNYGTSYIGVPYLGILAMIVFCVVLGIIEGYVAIRLKSAIPAAMIHSAVNAGAALPIYLVKSGYNPLLGPAITGLVGILPFAAVALVLFLKAAACAPGIAPRQAPLKLPKNNNALYPFIPKQPPPINGGGCFLFLPVIFPRFRQYAFPTAL
jgi:membrane protease YdiL (CAAX protease family)